MDRAEQAQIKAKRKDFLMAVATTRRDMVKMRTAQKKIKKELCKDIRVKTKAREKTRHTCVDSFQDGCDVCCVGGFGYY